MQVCMHAKLLQSCLNDRISKIIYSKLNSIQEILVEVLIGLCFFFFSLSSLQLSYVIPISLLSPWNSPGKNTRVSSHSLLQGIFPPQGLNPGLLHCRQILHALSHQGSPIIIFSTSLSYIYILDYFIHIHFRLLLTATLSLKVRE